MGEIGTIIIWAVVKMAILLGFALGMATVLTWMERRQSAMMQDRIGPTRANFGRFTLWGLIHPLADALKLATKEDFIPPKAHKVLFILAPVIALAPALMVFAVIPFAPPVMLDQLGTVVSTWSMAGAEPMQIANIDIGLLFVFAIASLGVYGTALAGWASYNNYGLLGGLRASAQMLSYEITMGMALVGVFLVYGTLEPGALVERQASVAQWGIVQQPLAFLLFFFAAIAETKRAPFDIPEGESEIVGYFVEYSGARFMTFYLGEFIEIAFVGCIITTVFLGGWHAPGFAPSGISIIPIIPAVAGIGLVLAAAFLLHKRARPAAILLLLIAAPNLGLWALGGQLALPHILVVALGFAIFCAKVVFVCFMQLAIRWTVPRMRYDQLMKLGWKGMLPASILNVVITAAVVLGVQAVRAVP